jgi:succinyl-CoA synthetase alpha subunit
MSIDLRLGPHPRADSHSNRLQAKDQLKPDACAVYVPGNSVAKAIEEAIEEEIPLVVAVAEFMPIHDLLRVRPLELLTKRR